MNYVAGMVTNIFTCYWSDWPGRATWAFCTVLYTIKGFHELPKTMTPHSGKSDTKKAIIATGFVGGMGLAGFVIGGLGPVTIPIGLVYEIHQYITAE